MALVGGPAPFIGHIELGRASAAVHHKTVTLHFMNAYNDVTEIPILDGVVIPAFEAANPGIKVIDENVPYNGMLNKFIATGGRGGSAESDALRHRVGAAIGVRRRAAGNLEAVVVQDRQGAG